MDDSVSLMEESVSLLERAEISTLLAPYDGSEKIRSLITQLQISTSKLPGFLRRFQQWVDLSERQIDTGHRPAEDLRETFQKFSYAVTEYMEGLSKLSQATYRRILSLQQDEVTDRASLAEMHEELNYANLDLVRLADVWLLLQHASRCMLFGNLTDDNALEDLEQPPPSPASDNSAEIMTEQAFSFHATMLGGVVRRQPPSPSPTQATAAPLVTTPLFVLIFSLLLVLYFLGML
ncbi:MAG: hypothetical protein Q9225_006483 [Loekoesia sp. 1 TL-2023]